jgi:LemA protein
MTGAMVALGLMGAVVLFIVLSYNRLVRLRNQFKNAFAQIDVQLKRRYDLIPNLVETAKAYMKHERETLEAVTEARARAVAAHERAARDPSDASAMQALMGAEGALAGALGRLNVAIEAYPELKADANMRQLFEELTTTENRVGFARQAYNDAVMTYNTRRESFPDNLVASWFNFGPAQLYEIEDAGEREPVRVSFDNP